MGPIHPMNFVSIGASVLLLLKGEEMQDGCRSGHTGNVATLIFDMVLFLNRSNKPFEFQIGWC